ncbi:DUF4255 domain-containing protein [Actinophytocola sp.]|uniref:DUF4255 domain-containing protein n=1 Tax=Actinophytocola sp. TaxID=1872138 RepID=UPI002ED39A72
MIHEVDEGVRLLLAEEGIPGNGVELAFDAPTKEWTAKRNAPTISMFLYEVREDHGRRRTGTIEKVDDDGTVVGWLSPPKWFQLSYLVTAWTNRPQDEHRLLSEVLRCLVRHERFARRWLTGTLAELDLSVTFETAVPAEGRSASDFWSALGGELKPSIDLRVTAPLAGDPDPAGPAVAEGLVLRAGPDLSGADGEPARRLRYEGSSTAEGAGFAPTRSRPLPSARRRRGTTPR